MFNLFFIAFAAVGLGLVISIFITRKSPPDKSAMGIPEQDYETDPKELAQLTLADLDRLTTQICQKNGLIIKEKIPENDYEIYYIANSDNPITGGDYVFALVETTENRPFISMTEVLKFKDFVKSVGSTKGFFFTTGYFLREVHQPLEGVKVTLYNRRQALKELGRLA